MNDTDGAVPPRSVAPVATSIDGRARRAALVATPLRSASVAVAMAVAVFVATYAYVTLAPGRRSLATLALPVAAAWGVATLLSLAILRSEEFRLGRELRIARTGTAALRSLVGRRRARLPVLGALFSTELGKAAVLIAEGDISSARDVLAAERPWMRVGRLETLRVWMLSDAERASGAPAALDRSIADLRDATPLGHREADLYRTHALVKAVLARGDDDTAFDLAQSLGRSANEDEQIYALWLRVWFELDSEPDGEWPPFDERLTRLAVLAARAHGAEKLVGKLEGRLLAIARPGPQG